MRVAWFAGSGYARADTIPGGWSASKMQAVGYAGLDGHVAPFKMAIRKVAEHWYLYTAHSGRGGLSIIDVTDPAQPKLVKFLPGPAGTSSGVWGMAKPYTAEQTSGNVVWQRSIEPEAPATKTYQEGAGLYDISDPINPKFLSQWEGHAAGTHRNGYPGGKHAFMSSTAPGFSGNILIIVDVSDPAHSKEAGRWWTVANMSLPCAADMPWTMPAPSGLVSAARVLRTSTSDTHPAGDRRRSIHTSQPALRRKPCCSLAGGGNNGTSRRSGEPT